MSISSMANAAVGRRPDYPPIGDIPRTMDEVRKAAGGGTAPGNAVTSALNVIVTYIPTEILTLYVAVLAALGKPTADGQVASTVSGAVIAFWAFLVATPVTVWVLYAAKVASDGKPLPSSPAKWPIWEMSAGTIAYVAWAIALPNNPYVRSAIAGVIVLVTSTALGLVAPLFQRPLKP
jgi:hypothetical protein